MITILVVEDSVTINKLVTRSLKNEKKYKVLSTYTLSEARKYLQEEKIDFIFLDINLPDGNGYELVEELGFKDTKIFVMTTEDDKQFVEMNYQKGVMEFIVKDKAFVYKVKKFPQLIEKIFRNGDKTVMIVDDSSFIRTQLEKLFRNRNYNVIAVSNTLEALDILQKEKIDFILLDIELKNENGIDFLKKHRVEIVDKKGIPVMIISGYIDDIITKIALKAGAVDVVKKPYVTEEIVQKSDFWIDYNTLNKKVDTLQQEFAKTLQKQELLETLLDVSMEMIFIHDENLEIVDLNKTAIRMLNSYSKEDIIGKNLKEFFAQESIATLQKNIQLENNDIFEGKIEKEELNVLIKTESFQNNNQKFFITSALDITEMKRKEFQLVQQSRLAQMGEMLSMIAHQWRQPLNVIAVLIEMMLLKAQTNKLAIEEVQSISKKIMTQVNYLSKTIDDFKEYFKPQKKPKRTTIETIILGVIELVEASLSFHDVQLDLELKTNKEIVTFENELQQAILNIVKNAESALEKNDASNRYITIRAYSEDPFNIIEIEDNGGGIDEKIMSKIFDPYFSTKDEKNGTGLGLYMAKMIIEKHCQGKLKAQNTKEGAKFIIELPDEIAV